MSDPVKGRGGPGRGQGRKPGNGGGLRPVGVRLTPAQALKLKMLGGSVWLREQIDKAPAPLGYYAKLSGETPEPETRPDPQPQPKPQPAKIGKWEPPVHLPPGPPIPEDPENPDRPF